MRGIVLCLAVGVMLASGAASSTQTAALPLTSAAIDTLLAASRYEDAERVSRESLAALEAAGAPDTLRAATMDRLVRALLGAGRWNDSLALATARGAVRFKEKVYGSEHGEVALSLISLGWMLYRGGAWEEATPIVERALDVSGRFHGERHRSVVRSLHLLASIFDEAGEFGRAESLFQRELELSIGLWGAESNETANTLNSLAVLYRNTGRFAQARPLYERALAIREKNLGPEHLDVSWSLNNYANLLGNMGDWTRAYELYDRALQIRLKRSGPDHPGMALGYNNLGTALSGLGDSTRAEEAFRKALTTQERGLAPDHPDRAMTLKNLGQLWTGRGRFEEADTALARALAIREKRFGRRSVPMASTLAAQGELSLARGRSGEAVRQYEEALAIAEELEIPESELMAELLDGYVRTLHASGRDSAAFDAAVRGQQLIVRRVRMTTRVLDERSALGYGGTRANALGAVLSLAAARGAGASRRSRAFDTLVASRAVVLDELAERHRAVRTAGDAEIARLAADLDRARERLAHLVVHGASGGTVERHRARIAAAVRERERAEALLAERSDAFRDEQAASRAGLDEVARALGAEDALVAYVRFRPPIGLGPVRERTDEKYGAYVLRGPAGAPAWVALGEAGTVDAAIRTWRAEATKRPGSLSRPRDERRCRQRGAALRKLVWDPMASHLADVRRVYVVPDGMLHEVALGALPSRGDRYLAEETAIHLLGAERDLATGPAAAVGRGALVMGALDYERAETGVGSRAMSFVTAYAPAKTTETAYRGGRSACVDFARLRFEPLPSSNLEVNSIASVWKQSPPAARGSSRDGGAVAEPAWSLSGPDATEGALKRLAPGRRVVHLATHGFFIGSSCGGGPADLFKENALLRSGLAMAGANRRAETPEGEEDGVLTAEEIGALDLSGVEWVVLSACDTGRGETRAYEGVLGLRRALQISGARTIVMSLWAVDDRATTKWMRELYRARLVHSKSTIDAVQTAYRATLRDRRARGLSDHPFYWGGFAAAGDWR